MSGKKNSDLEEWLVMDLPDDQHSEDEYDLDDILTDEQAQKKVDQVDNYLLHNEQFLEENELINNDDNLIFDFPEYDQIPSTSSNSSMLHTRTLRSQTSLKIGITNNQTTEIPIVVNVPANNVPAVPEIEQNVEINRQWKKSNEITVEQSFEQQQLYNENMFADCQTATDIFKKLIQPIIDNIID